MTDHLERLQLPILCRRFANGGCPTPEERGALRQTLVACTRFVQAALDAP